MFLRRAKTQFVCKCWIDRRREHCVSPRVTERTSIRASRALVENNIPWLRFANLLKVLTRREEFRFRFFFSNEFRRERCAHYEPARREARMGRHCGLFYGRISHRWYHLLFRTYSLRAGSSLRRTSGESGLDPVLLIGHSITFR